MNRAEALAALSTIRAQADALEAFLASAAANDAPATATPASAAPAPAMGLQKPALFYEVLREAKLLGADISAAEFGGCEAVLRACAGVYPASWAAYALATTFHETAGTMQPILEYGGESYFHRMYDIEGARPAKARELGNTTPGDGARYPGRGYVQLTGKANYAKATEKLRAIGFDVDLVADPGHAMRPDVAAAVMVLGMKEGWFTGKSLRDYIPAEPTVQHFTNARRIINGTDKAAQIAGHAVTFQRALRAGDWR